MNTKAKGSRAERRAMKILEAAGYICTRAGVSLGLFDVIAIGPTDVRLVQVKAGTKVLGRSRPGRTTDTGSNRRRRHG
jgi:Holliday junction resolvase